MNRVINLGACRDLLQKWGAVRERIIRGEVRAVAMCIKDADGVESVFLCGDYDEQPEQALRASMRMSWELTKQANPRP